MLDQVLSQFSLRGRTSRGTFLKRWLRLSCLSVLLLTAGVFLASQGIRFAGYAAAALILLLLIANYSMVVRRFHDRDRSGWWLVALFAIDVGSYFVDSLERSHPDLFIFSLLALLILNIWLLIELFFRRGTPGTNRFGEDPLVAMSQVQP